MLCFNQKIVYEIDVDLGNILVKTFISNYTLNFDFFLKLIPEINFPNKLITGFSSDNDLVFINYYTGKMELNFTNCTTTMGISFDKNKDLVADLVM